jgi:hypothetical protein
MKDHENELLCNKYDQSLKDKDQALKDKDHENELLCNKYEQSLKDKDHINEMLTMKNKTELQELELQYMRQLLKK